MIKLTDNRTFNERVFNAHRLSARGAELYEFVCGIQDNMMESGIEDDKLMSRLEGNAGDLSAEAYALFDEFRRA